MRTEFTVVPPAYTEVEIAEGEETVLPCEATTDDSTPLTIDWLHEDEVFGDEAGVRYIDPQTNYLHIWTETEEVTGKCDFLDGRWKPASLEL